MTEGKGKVRELPKGWCWLKLGEICQEVETRKPELEPEREFQYIDIASIDNAIKKIVAPKKYLGKNAPSRVRQVVKTNDIVFSTVRTYLMNIALVPQSLNNQIASTGFCVIRGIEEVTQKYIFYYTTFYQFINSLNELQRGTSYPAVRDKDIFGQLIPLCPTIEQNRIVEKIEELFSDLEQGIENLKKAQKQLKVYRQVVLKWAFEGKLTEKWRSQIQQEKLDIKTGEALLAQIKAERENRYQQKLAEWGETVKIWEKNGKTGKKLTKPQKFKDLSLITKLEFAELPQLPDDWCLERLGNLAEILGGVAKGRNLEDQETIFLPYLRVANVQDGYLDLSVIKHIKVLPSELDKYRLIAGDVLYTEGGDKDKLGRGSVWKQEIKDCIHQNHVFRARLLADLVIPSFIAYYSQTRTAKDYFFKRAKQTVNLASINMTILSNFPIPIPSHLEQEEIVQKIESRLSICDQLEFTIAENLQKAEALRQSILKQAFEGKLVPQDPNDEPSEKLLERIKQEKIKVKKDEQLSIQGI